MLALAPRRDRLGRISSKSKIDESNLHVRSLHFPKIFRLETNWSSAVLNCATQFKQDNKSSQSDRATGFELFHTRKANKKSKRKTQKKVKRTKKREVGKRKRKTRRCYFSIWQ